MAKITTYKIDAFKDAYWNYIVPTGLSSLYTDVRIEYHIDGRVNGYYIDKKYSEKAKSVAISINEIIRYNRSCEQSMIDLMFSKEFDEILSSINYMQIKHYDYNKLELERGTSYPTWKTQGYGTYYIDKKRYDIRNINYIAWTPYGYNITEIDISDGKTTQTITPNWLKNWYKPFLIYIRMYFLYQLYKKGNINKGNIEKYSIYQLLNFCKEHNLINIKENEVVKEPSLFEKKYGCVLAKESIHMKCP